MANAVPDLCFEMWACWAGERGVDVAMKGERKGGGEGGGGG